MPHVALKLLAREKTGFILLIRGWCAERFSLLFFPFGKELELWNNWYNDVGNIVQYENRIRKLLLQLLLRWNKLLFLTSFYSNGPAIVDWLCYITLMSNTPVGEVWGTMKFECVDFASTTSIIIVVLYLRYHWYQEEVRPGWNFGQNKINWLLYIIR